MQNAPQDLPVATRSTPSTAAPAARRAAERSAVEDLGSAVIAVDDGGRVIDCNPAASAVLGVEPGAALGRPVADLLPALELSGDDGTVERTVDRLVALEATLVATLALFPLEPFYLVLTLFPLVPLLYLVEGRPRRLLLAGGAVLSVPVTYPTVEVVAALAPAGVGAALRAGARATFGFALPPTYGVWLVLAACLLHQHRAATAGE